MRISDWSSDVCSSDLRRRAVAQVVALQVIACRVHQVSALIRVEGAGAGEVVVVAEAGSGGLVDHEEALAGDRKVGAGRGALQPALAVEVRIGRLHYAPELANT